MNEEISFPPLFDVPPGQLEAYKQHLLSEIGRDQERPRLFRRVVTPLRLRVALPSVALIGAALCAVVFTGALGGAKTHVANGGSASLIGSGVTNTLSGPPTLAHPLPSFAEQTTLGDATATLGAPIVLPNTSLVQPSDAGPVWVASLNDEQGKPAVTTVAVTFPSRGVIVEYTRPAPSDGTAAHFQAMAQGMVSPDGTQIARVVSLNGLPALAVQQNSDETGTNFGAIIFNLAGSEIRILGHTDQATLETSALSILNQSGPQ